MSTPGCFSFFKKNKAPIEPRREVSAIRQVQPSTEKAILWTEPSPPAAHEHYEPCFQCSSSGPDFGKAKRGLDELPAYTPRAPFSSDVSVLYGPEPS